MQKYSVKNITKGLWIKQGHPTAPITLVEEKDRTIFYEENEAEDVRAFLDDTDADCYTVIHE